MGAVEISGNGHCHDACVCVSVCKLWAVIEYTGVIKVTHLVHCQDLERFRDKYEVKVMFWAAADLVFTSIACEGKKKKQ